MIKPLKLPGPLIVPRIDWSGLDGIADAYFKNTGATRVRDATAAANAQMLVSHNFWEGILKLRNSTTPYFGRDSQGAQLAI